MTGVTNGLLAQLDPAGLRKARGAFFTPAPASNQPAPTTRSSELAVEVGLLDPGALAVETGVAKLLVIAAIERWLTGAEKTGALIG